MGKKRPTHEIKLEKIRAAIWANESKQGKPWFNVTVTNTAPQLEMIDDQVMLHSEDTRTLVLSATDDDGDAITYMDMPSDMSRFIAPLMPEPEDVLLMDGARAAMDWLRAVLDEYEPGGEPMLADLSALDEDSRDVVNQILGEGEVSIVCDGQVRARTQESVLAGVWRTLFFDRDDRVVCDLLEVAEVPKVMGFAVESEGAVEALASVGKPVTYTTACLIAGFIGLTMSQLQNQADFGALAAMLLSALGGAWTFT